MGRVPDWLRAHREAWRYRGQERPPFANRPSPGHESVWDYPRPPRLVPDSRRVRVELGGTVIADTTRSVRVLETASPPTFYLPPDSIVAGVLRDAGGGSMCEWKGNARYWHVIVADRTLERAAWSYPDPFVEFSGLAGYVSFYPALLECFVGDERVRPQPGGFYGGWVTGELAGPFKGERGTESW